MNKRILGIAPWVLLNILAMIAYLYFASAIWAPKGEKGLLGDPEIPSSGYSRHSRSWWPAHY